MAEPDDLPPLEDFSPLFKKLGSIKQASAASEPEANSAIRALPDEEKPKSGSFGGFQKGFLNQKPKKELPEDLALIKSDPSKEGASLKMNEMSRAVDDSMQQGSLPLLPENWLTEELLTKVESNPRLAGAFRHPDFSQVLTRFTQNPTQALKEFGDTPEFREFFQEICSTLGQHFTEIADEGDQGREIEDDEDRKMKEIFEKEEVQEVMRDSRIRQLVMDMKDNPERAQDTFTTASPQLRKKIHVLTENNIIGIQKS